MSSSTGYNYGLHQFYKDKTILMTGSTGFLGMIIAEKFIRSFPEIKQMIMLIRDKRGKSGNERMEHYFDNEVFARVKEENPSSLSKVVCLEGDITMENCGLHSNEIARIHKEINLVIHCAATVKFNELLRTSVNINLRGTLNMLKLCSEIKNLQSFVYISTMYSNCHRTTTEEKVYTHPIPPEKIIDLIDILDDETLERITPKLIGRWPNTYTYSKNAAENLVYSYRHNMPVAIFRPSIITAPYREPLPGWINKYMGPYCWIASAGLGYSRAVYIPNPECNTNMVPCDYVAHAIIAVMWDTGVQRNKSGAAVVNYTSGQNPLLWRVIIEKTMANFDKAPFKNCVWYPMCIWETSMIRYKIYDFFLQRLPAYVGDIVMILLNKKPMFVNIDSKISTSFKEMWPFLKPFQFQNDNIYTILDKLSEEDKRELIFDMKLVSWDEYCKNGPFGVKKYLLKDPMTKEALKKATVNYFWLCILDKLAKIGLLSVIIYLFKYIYKRIL